MLPGLLWFILVHEFTANKHNNFSHFNVLEAWAEIWMQVEQERPAPCKLKAVYCTKQSKELNGVSARKQQCMTLCADSGLCLGSAEKHTHPAVDLDIHIQ